MRKSSPKTSGNILFVGPFAPPYNGDGVKNSCLKAGFEGAGIKGVEWFDTIARQGPRWRNNLRLLAKMWGSPQIIFSLNKYGRYYLLPIFALMQTLRTKKGVLYVVGGSFHQQLQNDLSPWRRRWMVACLNRLDGVFAESRALQQGLEACGLRKVELVFNPRRDSGQRWDLNEAAQGRIVFISRVTRTKGIHDLLEAVGRLLLAGRCVQLDVYGPVDPMDEPLLQKAVRESGGRIKYCGLVEPGKVQEVLAAYHFLVLPTFHPGEGLPGVLVEAGMAGLPLLISRFSALPEYFEEGESALFTAPRDVAALVTAMERLLVDEALCRRLSTGVQKVVQPFRMEAVVAQSLDLLHAYKWTW